MQSSGAQLHGLGTPDAAFPPWLVRIFDASGPVGAGCLLDNEFIATCAHVVSATRGGRDGAPDIVSVDFPFVNPGNRLHSRVALDGWNLPVEADFQRYETAGRQDIAILQLVDELPRGASPPPFAIPANAWGHSVLMFGFPVNHDDGVWARGRLLGGGGSGWLQLEASSEIGYPVARGFSGSPVWDATINAAVGIVVAAERDQSIRASFCIPIQTISRFWPPLERALLRSEGAHSDGSGLFLVGLTVNGRQHDVDWKTGSFVDIWVRGTGTGPIALTDLQVQHAGGDGYGGGTGVLPVEAEYSFPFEYHQKRRHVLEPPLLIYPQEREFLRFRLGLYPSGNFPTFGGDVYVTLFYRLEGGEIGQLPLMRAPAGWKLLSRATAVTIPLKLPGLLGVCEVMPDGAMRGTAPAHDWESVPMVNDFDEAWLARPEYQAMLINAVADPDRDIRILAVRALGELGKAEPQFSKEPIYSFMIGGAAQDILDALSYAVGDEEKSVRAAAVIALNALNPTIGASHIVEHMCSGVAPLLEFTYMNRSMRDGSERHLTTQERAQNAAERPQAAE